MKYAVTIERPSFATVVIEAEDELEAERLAKCKMENVRCSRRRIPLA